MSELFIPWVAIERPEGDERPFELHLRTYRLKPQTVQAMRMEYDFLFATPHGEVAHGHAGNWLYLDEKGHFWRCPDAAFRNEYELEEKGEQVDETRS